MGVLQANYRGGSWLDEDSSLHWCIQLTLHVYRQV